MGVRVVVTADKVNDAILRMVGLYKVATRGTITALLPEGGEPDKRVQRFVRDGLLRMHKGLPGNRTVYQLTKKGAAAAGVSAARGRTIGTQSLLKNLGVLLFCHVPSTKRHRVEAEQLGRALKIELPDGAYCLCEVNGKVVIFDCYVPAPHTPIPTIVRHLRKQLFVAKKTSVLWEAIRDLRYGFALVVSSQARRKTIMDNIRTRGPDEKIPLIKRVRIWVEAVEELGAIFGSSAPRNGSAKHAANQTPLFET
jgi:hypothetical protein